jgi:hypothetical protein
VGATSQATTSSDSMTARCPLVGRSERQTGRARKAASELDRTRRRYGARWLFIRASDDCAEWTPAVSRIYRVPWWRGQRIRSAGCRRWALSSLA